MRIRRVIGACVGVMLAAGCASVQTTPQAAITNLEAQRAKSPKSVGVLRGLGVQYYKAQRYPEAKAALTEAATLAPSDGVVALYLGLAAEAMNDIPAARTAYASYLKVGKTQKVRRQLETRLAGLQRLELQLAAKAAVQREAQLSATPGNPRTIAVLPFSFSGVDSTLKPLERGFAELLTTDLSRVRALTVVERTRLQAILDEIKLSQTGNVDSTTQVRAGKLIQAGTLVQGTILQTGDRLRADAALVSVATSRIDVNPARDEQAIDRLFDIEKRIVLSLLQTLAVPITTAERNAIELRPTRSLAAFLAYSQGLVYEDQGRFDDASKAYANAASIDPSFGAASTKSTETATLAAASSVTTTTVEASLQGSAEAAVVTASNTGSATPPAAGGGGSTGGAAQAAAESLNPSTVAAATGGTTTTTTQTPTTDPSAGRGADNPSKPQSKVVIVIKPPTE